MRPSSAELLLRIEGQSRDVECALQTLELDPAARDDAALERVAQGARAQAVIAIEQDGGYAVQVFHADTRPPTRERRAVNVAHAEGEVLGESATFEAIALVVRSALLELASAAKEARARADASAPSTTPSGQTGATPNPELPKPGAHSTASEEDSDDSSDEDASGDASASSGSTDPSARPWRLGAGAEITAIGAGEPAFALALRIARDLGPLRLGLAGAFGFPAALDDASTALRLRRHVGLIALGLPWRASRRFELEALLTSGVVVLARSTRALAAGVTRSADASTWSAAFGVELGATLWVVGSLGLRAHAALELVPGAPRYAYEDVYLDASQPITTERAGAAIAQPRAGVTAILQF